MPKTKAKKPQLYFLKDEKLGVFWDGRYMFEYSARARRVAEKTKCDNGWSDRPRFFKTIAALCASFTKFPKVFVEDFEKTHPKPPAPPKGEYYGAAGQPLRSWQHNLWRAWVNFCQEKKPTSLEKIEMYKQEGLAVYAFEEGKAMRSAKII